jgi:two-component system chemotaxis response regulator CheB
MPHGSTKAEKRCSCAVGIIASAGGIPATIELLRSLETGFEAPIILAQHLPRVPSLLDQVLRWHTKRDVVWAKDGETPASGLIYLCPPGAAVQITPAGFRLQQLHANSSSWLHFPDLLLESMCDIYGSRLAAVVLSGALPTAVRAVRRVRAAGGFTMAQSEASSSHFAMPCAAIDIGKAEIFASPTSMAKMLNVISEQWAID